MLLPVILGKMALYFLSHSYLLAEGYSFGIISKKPYMFFATGLQASPYSSGIK